MTAVRVCAFAAIGLAAACGANEADTRAHVDALPRLELREQVHIGSVDDPDLGFTSIGDITVDHEGRLYVAETTDDQIRVYDGAGQLLRRIGREGEGPGEFRRVRFIGVVGDTLWVSDASLRRMTLFDPEGRVLRTIPTPMVEVEPIPGVRPGVQASRLLPDGRLLGVWQGTYMEDGASTDSFAIPRLVFDQEGGVVDTLGFRIGETVLPAREVTIAGRQIFIPDLSDASRRAEGDSWQFMIDAPIAPSSTEGYFTVTRTTFADDTVYHRQLRYEPMPFPRDYARAYARMYVATYLPTESIDPAILERGIQDALELPPFRPPVWNHYLADDGGIWLQLEERLNDAATDWAVIDPEGMPVGRVTVPGNVTVRWNVGSEVWSVVRDEFDVQWLVKYALVPTRS